MRTRRDHRSYAAIAAWIALNATVNAATYWVATDGSDSNAGTSNAPFATPQKAVTLSTLAPGDTIYLRGGTYALTSAVKPKKPGAPDNYFKLWAYPGERPVFDFSGATGVFKAVDIRTNYWHVKGIEVAHATDNGIFVASIGNIIEGCVIHDCDNDGLTLGSTTLRATNALILNCDSYRNFQTNSSGNNGDGFSAKSGCGPGNVFRGCRAWDNADDGWDFYDNNVPVVLENCWAMTAGFDHWGVGGSFSGNGNGFKLGGEGTVAEHHLTNCVAIGNRSKGFDHNNGNAGQTMVNCTSYNNNVDFSFYETPSGGTLLHNVLINNVAFGGTLTNLAANSVQVSNSWQGFTVNTADFASLDTSVATATRNADYSLPITRLLRLAAGSDLIDRGVNVGLPFNGNAPDLGAFESGSSGGDARQIECDASSTLRFTNGGFNVRATGFTSHGAVVLYVSSNLTSWAPILTNPATTGASQFLDASATSRPLSFYRVEEK